MFGTLPSRASSGETRRSRSPRKRSTTTPKRWLRSLATTTGKDSPIAVAVLVGELEHASRVDQAHELIVEQDVRLPLEVADLRAVDHQDAVDPAEGEGVGLAGDLDQEGADDRDGDRQLEDEPRPLAGPAGDADRAAHRVHHALHDVEADAAAGDLRDLLLGREAGQEEEIEQLGLAEPSGHRGGGQPALDDLGAEPFEVDAAAVVAEDDLEHPRAVAGLQADRRHRRLAGGAAILGRLDAVVQGVADQVVERRLEPVEDVAVDAGGLAVDLEPRLLAQLAGQVADQAREAADAVGQRPHPAGQHLVVQPAGEVLAGVGERLDRLDRLAQALQVLGGLARALASSSCPAADNCGRRSPAPANRSSRICKVSSRPICRSLSRQSASTSGRSRWLCTRDSPARPISRLRLSAVTRTTRSRSAGLPGGSGVGEPGALISRAHRAALRPIALWSALPLAKGGFEGVTPRAPLPQAPSQATATDPPSQGGDGSGLARAEPHPPDLPRPTGLRSDLP